MPNENGKGQKLPEEKTDELMNGYVQQTPAEYLDQAFAKWDNIIDKEYGGSQLPHLNRADHILINGRSVTEMLVDEFNVEFPKMRNEFNNSFGDYERYLQYSNFLAGKGGKKYIQQFISNALANGDKVEVFVPDPVTGQIKNQPMRLNHTGYWPANPVAKPAQLSRWKRFWGKLGFYKQEVEQYRQATESYDAQQKAFQKVQFCNRAARAGVATNYALLPTYVKEMFDCYPELKTDMDTNYPKAKGNPAELGYANGFKTKRTSFVVTALSLLATKRDPSDPNKFLYTNEELFDTTSPKMQQARAAAMKETYEKYKAGDKAWLAQLHRDACEVLPERIDRQAAMLDFSRTDLVDQKGYRTFALLNDTAWDVSQDATETLSKEEYNKITTKVAGASRYAKEWSRSLTRQEYIINGVTGPSEAGLCTGLVSVFKAQVSQQAIAKGMGAGKKFCDVAVGEIDVSISTMTDTFDYVQESVDEYKRTGRGISAVTAQSLKLANEAIQNPEKFNEEIMNGVFETRFKLKALSLDPKVEVPITFEITSSATAKRKIERQQARTRAGGDIGIGLGG